MGTDDPPRPHPRRFSLTSCPQIPVFYQTIVTKLNGVFSTPKSLIEALPRHTNLSAAVQQEQDAYFRSVL